MSIRNAMINSWFLPENFYRRTTGHAYPDQAEFICPQAFGRNTYSDEHVGLAIHEMQMDCNHDTIATFKQLKSQGFNPGQPNRILARRCIGLATARRLFVFTLGGIKATPLPVIGQWEVLYAMWFYEPDLYAKYQDALIPIWPPLSEYLGTRGMMWAARDIAEAHGLKVPLIVAHPEHVQRCFFIARKIFDVAATDHIDGMVLEEWFDQHSVQKWTTSPDCWLAYEMLTRIHHRLHSWI
jgi:hypothetical protein